MSWREKVINTYSIRKNSLGDSVAVKFCLKKLKTSKYFEKLRHIKRNRHGRFCNDLFN